MLNILQSKPKESDLLEKAIRTSISILQKNDVEKDIDLTTEDFKQTLRTIICHDNLGKVDFIHVNNIEKESESVIRLDINETKYLVLAQNDGRNIGVFVADSDDSVDKINKGKSIGTSIDSINNVQED